MGPKGSLFNLGQHCFDVGGRRFILDGYTNSRELFLHVAQDFATASVS
jgi:hypothetical protein